MVALPPEFDPAQKYPLLVADPRRRRQHVARPDHAALELPPARAARLRRAADQLPGSTGFGEKFARDIQGDPLAGPADEINEAADEAIRALPVHRRRAAGRRRARATAGTSRTGWRPRPRATSASSATPAWSNLESQWGTSDAIYHRELMTGGPAWEQAARSGASRARSA